MKPDEPAAPAGQGPAAEAGPPTVPDRAEAATVLVLKPHGAKQRFRPEAIRSCDFRQPSFLTASELRRFRLRHQDFIRALAARLSLYLRLEVGVELSRLHTLSYRQFSESLAQPTHLTLFKTEPLPGICILEIPPVLGLAMVNRLLGGNAQAAAADSLSEIETALLDQAAQVLLAEWCRLWANFRELRPVLLGHESNGRFLQTSASDTAMLVVAMEFRLADCVAQIQVAFPCPTLEPLARYLSSRSAEGKTAAPAAAPPAQWNPTLNEVCLLVTAEWPDLELSAGDLAGLRCGDVVLLEPRCFEQVQIRFQHLPKYLGRLGTRNQNWAVELVEPVNSRS